MPGWRTTTPCTRIPGWAIAHPENTSCSRPNPPSVRSNGVNSTYLVARERDWVLSRIAEKPDLTLRALLKELADRGLVVSYYALWHFLQHEGVTFKKKPSRLRTGPAGRR